jgi:SulP family sulfate permease
LGARDESKAANRDSSFRPAIVAAFQGGYRSSDLCDDALAGLTVAIVALPLSMALAIASGLPPERGLYTAIIGGFLISLLGGSRFQIGGPAGAFIVLVSLTVERHGYEGLVLATALAGLIMIALGLLRLGATIKYIPHPVTVGFAAGIAVIIFASQLRDFLGLEIAKEPGPLFAKIDALWNALGTMKPLALGISVTGVAIILLVRKFLPRWPSFLIVVVLGAIFVAVFHPDVATIGSRFGAVPNSLPAPTLPIFSWQKIHAVWPDAIAIALLGSIESLLSAVVADRMSGDQHRSNGELVAQGVANVGSVAFGGIPVTGTIARTATNIRAGAKSPVSGILHAIYLLVFMMLAAPLAVHIPLSALAAVLVVVAFNMSDHREFRQLLKKSWPDAIVLLAVFLITAFYDLVVAIGIGVAISFLFRAASLRRNSA